MDEQTRYRVTGSLFLLAIAVIVFPMLFDRQGLAPVNIEPLNVPQTVPDVSRRVDVAPDSDLMKRAEELAQEIDEDGFMTEETGTRFGEPVLSETDASTSVWAVQLASFSEQENALKLRDRLREEGYEAFISTVRKSGDVLYRVAIGPMLDPDSAESLRVELSASLALEARVVAFSN